jgi:hypothetical protein
MDPKILSYVEWGLAAVLLVVTVMASPGLAYAGGALLLGLAWLALAWTSGLCPLVVAGLLFFTSRWEIVQVLPATAWIASAFGVSAWAVSNWKIDKTTGFISGLLWTLPTLLVPGLLPLTLSGYPRLSRMHAEHSKVTRWPGILLLLAALVGVLFMDTFPEAFLRIRSAEAYAQWGQALLLLASGMVLWTALPLVGVFEVAQKQPDDLRMTWRNLPMFGMLASACFLTPEVGLGLFFLNAIPLSSILLVRWTFALKGWAPRMALWAGLLFFMMQEVGF